jgi:putative phosphoribosyl transferase
MAGTMVFRDRTEAGQILASALDAYTHRPGVLVLALPRGGVVVAFEVAEALDADLDVFLVRKLGAPGQEELALGALATGGVRVLNQDIIKVLGVSNKMIDAIVEREQAELERRERLYRGDLPALNIAGKTIILVDDGMATGSSARAAVTAIRQQRPARIVVAVPVASTSACDELQTEVDDLVCLVQPRPFFAVGQWYEDFRQTTDEEVRELVARAALRKVRAA